MKRLTLAKMMGLTAVFALVLGCFVNPPMFIVILLGSHVYFAVSRLGPRSNPLDPRNQTRAGSLARVAGSLAVFHWIGGLAFYAIGISGGWALPLVYHLLAVVGIPLVAMLCLSLFAFTAAAFLSLLFLILDHDAHRPDRQFESPA